MRITGLMRRLSLIGIDAIWQLSLGCLLMRTIASFIRYTGYLNFINRPISRVLLLIQVNVQLLSCLFLTSCLTAIKNHVINYCTTVYERNGKNLFWSIKNSGEILNKLKSRGFLASGLSTYDFSTLFTTLPLNLIKENLTELIEQTFNREGSLYLACNDKNAFYTSEQPKRYKLWSCQKMCDALHYLLDNIIIRFGLKLYRQHVGIPIVLLLLQICFCFVMRETLCCLCQTIIKLILLKLLTQPPDI